MTRNGFGCPRCGYRLTYRMNGDLVMVHSYGEDGKLKHPPLPASYHVNCEIGKAREKYKPEGCAFCAEPFDKEKWHVDRR